MRDLSPSVLAALEDQTLRPVLLYEGEFASGTIRFWSGLGNLVWDSKDWIGAGTIAGVSPIEESTDIRANGVRVSLQGIDAAIVSLVLQEIRHGRSGKLWFGLLTEDGQVIADPHQVFQGRLDVPEINDDGTTATVAISYESRLIDLERAREFRYTDESQQEEFLGDRGFEYVESLQDWNGVWGRS